MRVAVISDIHANQHAFTCVRDNLRGYDEIWFLGDLYGRGKHPIAAYYSLSGLDNLGIQLSGNHDLAVAGETNFLNDMNRRGQSSSDREIAELHRQVLNQVVQNELNMISERPVQLHKSRLIEKNRKQFGDYEIWLAHGWPSAGRREAAITYDTKRAPLLNSNLDFRKLPVEHSLAPDSNLWLIGHSHRQTAWLWESDSNKWRELIPGFGQGLTGENRPSDEGSRATYHLRMGDLLILNPGSIGDARDAKNNISKYLSLYFRSPKIIDIEFKTVEIEKFDSYEIPDDETFESDI